MRQKIERKAILLQVFFVLAIICQANATIIDVCDGTFTIEDGEEYHTISVYNDAVVNMTGGLISHRFRLYNDSIGNISGGVVYLQIEMYNSAKLNLSGGNFEGSSEYTWISPSGDNSKVHFYGYDFELTVYSSINTLVEGFWADDTPFAFVLERIAPDSPKMFFTEVPEPATLLLLGLSAAMLRKKVID